jgi:hypothetical protein
MTPVVIASPPKAGVAISLKRKGVASQTSIITNTRLPRLNAKGVQARNDKSVVCFVALLLAMTKMGKPLRSSQ